MIWKRYFYKEIIRTFCFLLFGFYALYIVLDLMTHIKDLRTQSTSFSTWAIYYLCTFSRRLDVLIPFSVLIGTIRILIALQTRNELVALLASGVPLRTLFGPFIKASLVASAILYANFEWALPIAQPRAIFIQENDFGKRHFEDVTVPIHEVLLKDASRMIYRSYNPIVHQFQDVFWIASLDKVYHMKTLTCETERPTGKMVDLMARNSQGELEKVASYPELKLAQMQFDEESLKNSIMSPRDVSISMLYSQMKLYRQSMSERASDVRANFIYKVTFPLLCLLATIAPASYCLAFRRHIPHFMIYLVAIGGLFCFFLLVQVALVLAKSQVVSPFVAFGVPWIGAFLGFRKDYLKVMNGTV